MEHLIEQLLSVLRGIVRWRWAACAVAWIVSVAGWAWVSTLPDVYRSYSRIYVDTDTLLNPLLSGLTVRPNTAYRVQLMASTLLSRPNIEEVIRRADLDHSVHGNLETQRLIDEVAEKLALSGGGGGNLYQLSYTAEDPKLAARVVREAVRGRAAQRGVGAGEGAVGLPVGVPGGAEAARAGRGREGRGRLEARASAQEVRPPGRREMRMRFVIEGRLEAEGIDDAIAKLAAHFKSLSEEGVEGHSQLSDPRDFLKVYPSPGQEASSEPEGVATLS